MWRDGAAIDLPIVLRPAINEEHAATAVMGSQLVGLDAEVSYILMDLASLDSVRKAAAEVLEQVEGMDEPDDDDKSVDQGLPLELAFDGDQADLRQEPEQTIELDSDSLGEMLSEMIGSHVDSAIRRAQGRID